MVIDDLEKACEQTGTERSGGGQESSLAQGFPLVGSLEQEARRPFYTSSRGQLWLEKHQRGLEGPGRRGVQAEPAELEKELSAGPIQWLLLWLLVGSSSLEPFSFHKHKLSCVHVEVVFRGETTNSEWDWRDLLHQTVPAVWEAVPEEHRETDWKTYDCNFDAVFL